MGRPAIVALTTAAVLVLPLGAVAAAGGGSARVSDAAAQRTNRTAVTALETWRIDHGSYAGATLVALARVDPSLADAPGLRLSRLSGTGYRVTTHSSGGRVFRTTRRAGAEAVAQTCAPRGAGACAADGTWVAEG